MEPSTLSVILRTLAIFLVTGTLLGTASGEQRAEYFDHDPRWDARNNRSITPEPQLVTQQFGYSKTNHAGGAAGEIGGMLTPAAEPAYYARPIELRSFEDELVASGKFAATGRHFHVLVGFFNAGTVNEWRTSNSIVLRLYGRGEVFYAYVEYATSRWRAGADSPGGFATVIEPETGKPQLKGFARGTPHAWSLRYDPQGNGGTGSVIAKIDDEAAVCHLDPGHKQDGATFNRFGVLNIPKHFDQGGETWLDDLALGNETEHFDADPHWEAIGTQRTYRTFGVRPRFNFGFTPTQFAGGRNAGELGGEVFRGDARYPERLAYYGDRLERLALVKPIRAGGKVAMRRGISDSTTLLGFFNSQTSATVSDSPSTGFPRDFLGVAVEGPSREGFLLYPVYHFADGAMDYARGDDVPHILPNGDSHNWSLEYSPPAGGLPGTLRASLDGNSSSVEIARLPLKPTEFDRFGIVTTWIDGNSQHVYFDDLTYTFRQ
jgi:hypothetical protein